MNATPQDNASVSKKRQRRQTDWRRGSIIVLMAFMMVALLGMVAFSVDTGYILTVRTELKRAADAGALAGAGVLVDGADETRAVVGEFVALNQVAQNSVDGDDLQIEVGHWDPNTRSFSESDDIPSAVRVRLTRREQPLFFGRILGRDSFDTSAESIAMYQPRDILLVLDYSASMNDDSELQSINRLGRQTVESNILQIWQELGSPTWGNMQFTPRYISSTNNNAIRNDLGLNHVPYPYPSGSWDEYINYVKSNSNVNNAGYRQRYGYLTFMNFLMESKPGYNQTPVLWQTSQQPMTLVKNAVTVFLAYLQEVDTDDRLGLSVYNSPNQTARLESELTRNFDLIEEISRERQAGHYDQYTNIGAGMQTARLELVNNARPGAFRLMVLMTDGVANRPSNTNTARTFTIAEAQRAAAARIPIITISLGASADKALMQQVADITRGVHFNVPGGANMAEYEEDLKDVFRSIADDRPLKLVQ